MARHGALEQVTGGALGTQRSTLSCHPEAQFSFLHQNQVEKQRIAWSQTSQSSHSQDVEGWNPGWFWGPHSAAFFWVATASSQVWEISYLLQLLTYVHTRHTHAHRHTHVVGENTLIISLTFLKDWWSGGGNFRRNGPEGKFLITTKKAEREENTCLILLQTLYSVFSKSWFRLETAYQERKVLKHVTKWLSPAKPVVC